MIQTQLNWLASQQQAMTTALMQWSSCNSGSFNITGLRQMAGLLSAYIQQHFDCHIEQHSLQAMTIVDNKGQKLQQELGPLLSIKKAKPSNKGALKVLFCGHFDTVFPIDNAFQEPIMVSKNTVNGPGVADMKGGILVMLNALRAIEDSPLADNLDWEIILNPDEEIGSLGSAPVLAQAAKQADIGLIYEPCMPDGYLAGARKGSGNFSLVVHGKAAHAGREFDKGRNAIAALAEGMSQLVKINSIDSNITLNLGSILGGGPNNVVADLAICHFNIRVSSLEEQQLAEEHVAKVVQDVNQANGIRCELHGGFNRPPKHINSQQQKLMDLVLDCSQQLNIETGFRATGGCCDGNNLSDAGLINIDTLGVHGGDIHSDKEYMYLDSLVSKSQLSALLLSELIETKSRWITSTR